MSLAILQSVALVGLEAVLVRVEVHIGPGLPSFNIVGLPDTGIRESRDRIRAALVNSGFDFPVGRITANLAPADLPKESSRYDLPIAIGLLLASGQVSTVEAKQDTRGKHLLSQIIFAGELSLTGALVPIAGTLAMGLGLVRHTQNLSLVLPNRNADLVCSIPGLSVFGARSLDEVCAHLSGHTSLTPKEAQGQETFPLETSLCLSEVKGQNSAKRALIIAAAGGHSLLMSGPPGSGKSMLAQRLPSLLPKLSVLQSLEVSAIHQLTTPQIGLLTHSPFRAPHHSSSMVAMIGGGAKVRPGEISLAHRGVLFLDELPEFQRSVLESLREPLEANEIHLARARYRVSFPSNFQLIAAMNPCPCGWLGHARKPCRCLPDQVSKYRAKVSGPLLDRVDLLVNVVALDKDMLLVPKDKEQSSARIQDEVQACRELQYRRQACLNHELKGDDALQLCQMSDDSKALWLGAMDKWAWSGRVAYRILKVARTIADIQGSGPVLSSHLTEAFQYRLW